jgi:hypothetical protein
MHDSAQPVLKVRRRDWLVFRWKSSGKKLEELARRFGFQALALHFTTSPGPPDPPLKAPSPSLNHPAKLPQKIPSHRHPTRRHTCSTTTSTTTTLKLTYLIAPSTAQSSTHYVGRRSRFRYPKCGDCKAYLKKKATLEKEHALILAYRLSPATRVSTLSPTRSQTALHRKSKFRLYAQLSIRYGVNYKLTSNPTVPSSVSVPNADSSVRPQSHSRSLTSRTPSARSPASLAAN